MKKWTAWILALALTAALMTPGVRAAGEKKLIALTFDDGPSQYTDKILDTLAQYGAKATFFVSGYRLNQYEAKLQRIAREGHEIGNHTQNHKTLTKLTAETLAYEIDTTLNKIKTVAGDTAYILRPVGGAYNTRVCEAARGPVILWSLDTLDWKNRDSSYVYNRIMSARDGDVVLMHDLYKTTAAAACKAIPKLIEKGYELVTVSELYRRKGVTLENGKVYRGAYDYATLAAAMGDAYPAVAKTKTASIEAGDNGAGAYAVTLDDTLFGGKPLTVTTPCADVTLLPEAVRGGPVTVSVRRSGADVSVEVSQNGARMEKVSGGIRIGLPGTNLTAASVAASIAPDGSRTPIARSAAVSATTMRAYVGGSAVVGIDAAAGKPFRDSGADWAKSAVEFVSARGLLSGVSADMFGVYACVTRGMITAVLWRMEGSPRSAAALTFTDVKASQYYAPAVAWAAEAGIVSGVGGRKFAPESGLTREQAIVLLYHYGGGSASGNAGTLPCADWAKDAYAWAKASGVLTETDAAWARPGGAISRTEVAVLLYRFITASLYV